MVLEQNKAKTHYGRMGIWHNVGQLMATASGACIRPSGWIYTSFVVLYNVHVSIRKS